MSRKRWPTLGVTSVIRPGAYCGVAAFKPSYKLLPTIGVKCYAWSLDTLGFYGAGVADVAFATAAMSGRDLRVDRATPAAPRVALVRTHIWADASADMQNAVETAARALESAGASVKVADAPEGGEIPKARVDRHDDVAPAAAVAAVGAALRHVLLAPEAQAAVAATTRLDVHLRAVVEHDRTLASMRG